MDFIVDEALAGVELAAGLAVDEVLVIVFQYDFSSRSLCLGLYHITSFDCA